MVWNCGQRMRSTNAAAVSGWQSAPYARNSLHFPIYLLYLCVERWLWLVHPHWCGPWGRIEDIFPH